MTIWNSTTGYVFVKAKPANAEVYFMNDGNGGGTNKFSTLQGTIDVVVYLSDSSNYVINSFVIPPHNISYQSDLNYISTRPD